MLEQLVLIQAASIDPYRWMCTQPRPSTCPDLIGDDVVAQPGDEIKDDRHRSRTDQGRNYRN